MNNKKIQLFTSMSDLERVNERFAKVKIRIAYAGENRNGSYISKETFEKAIPTLKFCPVVGYVCEDGEFDGHTEKLEIIGDEWNFKSMTQPYGVVTDEEPFWEDVKTTNGEFKSYLTCYAMLWIARYPELETIKQTDYSQSMEIICNKGNFNEADGLYHIEDLTFDAMCILQKKEPCFEDSTISLNFSKEIFEKEYKSMIEEFKKYTFELMEGGNAMDNNEEFEKKKRKCSKCETEHEVSDDFSDDEEFVCDSCKEENMFSKKTTTFELSFDDIREKLYNLIKTEDCYCWIVETFTDKFIYVKETWEDDKYECRYYKQGYEMENEDIKLVGDSTEVFAKFLTQEEIDKVNEEKQSYVNNIETLKAENYDLQTKFSEINTEVESLREYKAEIEKAKFEVEEANRKKSIDSELEEFSELSSYEGYKEIMDKKYEVDVKTSKILLKALAYDNGVILGKKKNFSKKDKTVVTIPIENIHVDSEKDPYDGILDKYINKK